MNWGYGIMRYAFEEMAGGGPMATQLTFSDYERDANGRRTHKAEFLDDLDRLVPWEAWVEIARDAYDDSEGGRRAAAAPA